MQYTIEQARRRLRRGVCWFYREIKAGNIPARLKMVGRSRTWIIESAELERIIVREGGGAANHTEPTWMRGRRRRTQEQLNQIDEEVLIEQVIPPDCEKYLEEQRWLYRRSHCYERGGRIFMDADHI